MQWGKLVGGLPVSDRIGRRPEVQAAISAHGEPERGGKRKRRRKKKGKGDRPAVKRWQVGQGVMTSQGPGSIVKLSRTHGLVALTESNEGKWFDLGSIGTRKGTG